MAKRAPDAARLGLVAILPDLRAYDDLHGVNGAWQQLMDQGKVQAHLSKGGRVHLAVEDRWLVAYPAAMPGLSLPSRISTGNAPGSTVLDRDGIHQVRPDGPLGPHPWTLQAAIAQGMVYMPSPRFEPPC